MAGILFFRVEEVSKPIWLKSNMLRTTLEEGFKRVTTKDEARRIMNNGDCAFYDAGADEVIIAIKDIPLAIAATPFNVRARIMHCSDCHLIATTCGNIVFDCMITDITKKIKFLDEVRKYQAMDNEQSPLCSYIEEDSEFDELYLFDGGKEDDRIDC